MPDLHPALHVLHNVCTIEGKAEIFFSLKVNTVKLAGTHFATSLRIKGLVVTGNTIDLMPVDIKKHLIWLVVTHSWETGSRPVWWQEGEVNGIHSWSLLVAHSWEVCSRDLGIVVNHCPSWKVKKRITTNGG